MNKLHRSLLCALGVSAVSLLALPASAQLATNAPPVPSTNAIPTGVTSFAQTAMNYFTSFNTNLDDTFGTQRGEAAAGIDSIQGGKVPMANSLRVSYDLYKIVSVESVTRDGGVSGGFISEQAGAGVNWVIHDAKFTVYCDGGYDETQKKMFGEVGARAEKALTAHTFMGAGIGTQFPRNSQVETAFVGFTF